ncbi:hypothetical protein CYY_008123 [Polysphondylium violaceum]|uniref:F-box domain-containing protein n=1 Tax=Polysphondylium violaceum TaxID=133409 RepID=A0A8J4UX75_9MYCE|nr:hypothetical protein CYY_008123 [Polysphondylium violaceum]
MKSLLQKFKGKVLHNSLQKRQDDLNEYVNDNNYNSLHYKNKGSKKVKDLPVKNDSNKSDYYYYYYYHEQQAQQQAQQQQQTDQQQKQGEDINIDKKDKRSRSNTISLFKSIAGSSKKEKKGRSNSVFNTPTVLPIVNTTTAITATTTPTTRKVLIYDNYMCLFPSTVVNIILYHYFQYYSSISKYDFKIVVQSIQNIGLVCKEWHYNILPRIQLPKVVVQDDPSMEHYYRLVSQRQLKFKKFSFTHNNCKTSALGNILSDLIQTKYNTKLDIAKYTLPPPPWSSNLMEISKPILDNSITVQFSDHIVDHSKFFELNIGQVLNATGTKKVADKITLKGTRDGEVVQLLLDTYENFSQLTLGPYYSRSNDASFVTCSFKSMNLTQLFIQVKLEQNSYTSILQDCTNIQTLHLIQTGVEPFIDSLIDHPSITELKIANDHFPSDFVLTFGNYLNNNQKINSIILSSISNNNNTNNNNNNNNNNNHSNNSSHSSLQSTIQNNQTPNIYFKKSPFIENCTLKSLSMHFGKDENSLSDQILESWKSSSGIVNLVCEYYFNPTTILFNHTMIRSLLFKDFNLNNDYCDKDGPDTVFHFQDLHLLEIQQEEENIEQQQKLKQQHQNDKEFFLFPQLSNILKLNINDQIFNGAAGEFDSTLTNQFFGLTPDLMDLTLDWNCKNLKILDLVPEKILNLKLNAYTPPDQNSSTLKITDVLDLLSRFKYLKEFTLHGINITPDISVEKFAEFLLNTNIESLYFNYTDKEFENKLFKLLI